MVNNFYGKVPPFYSKEFPFNMGGQFMNGPVGNSNNQPGFSSFPWNMLMQPPFKNFENMMAPYHQFNQQQQAFLQSLNNPQNSGPSQNISNPSPQNFMSLFDHLDGVMKNVNKYYPYVKKAGSFLSNFNKMM